MRNKKHIIIVVIGILLLSFSANAQPCDSLVPTLIVDLSSSPDSIWTSADTGRVDHCCGATGSSQCIEFIVTLHPDAEGITFDVIQGSIRRHVEGRVHPAAHQRAGRKDNQ